MLKRLGGLCLAGVIWAFAPPLQAQTPPNDSFDLQGQLIQGTADGQAIPVGLPLRLSIFDENGDTLRTLSTASKENGLFTFPQTPRYPQAQYVVSTSWAGLEQTSIPVRAAELSGLLGFPLYEVTDSLAEVVASRGNLRVEFSEVNDVGLQMLLELTYINLGDKIVLQAQQSPQPYAFTLELPVGAFGIAPESAPNAVQRYIALDEINNLPIPALRDTQPLLPNLPNVLRASFFVPYESGAVIDMRFPFAVSGMALFVREDTVRVDSPILRLSERTETTSGRVYVVYEQSTPLDPNQPFKFTLTGDPTLTTRPTSSNRPAPSGTSTPAMILLVFGLLAALILVGLMLWLRGAKAPQNV
jgi:hypothetical protein